jgi:hypothetical protein
MKTGREPLRTFGDLKQFFDAHHEPSDAPAGKTRKRGKKPKPSESIEAEQKLDQIDLGSGQAAAAAEAGHEYGAVNSGERVEEPPADVREADPAAPASGEAALASSETGASESEEPLAAPAVEPTASQLPASSPEAAANEKPETD